LLRVASVRTREYGVRATDLEAQRAALIEFAAEMYRPLVRCDQRAKGEQYVRGLLLEGRRKSIQPMAARLADGDEEGLQHFITDSPWDDEPVRRRLARRMTAEIEPDGWIVDDTGLPKDGRCSPGVAHQHCGALGKTANCRVLVSVNAASDRASCPLSVESSPGEWCRSSALCSSVSALAAQAGMSSTSFSLVRGISVSAPRSKRVAIDFWLM
jgi:SRSO17 transposase